MSALRARRDLMVHLDRVEALDRLPIYTAELDEVADTSAAQRFAELLSDLEERRLVSQEPQAPSTQTLAD